MKKRMGFVSNSSSSSFIIGCKKTPTTLEEAKTIWFDNKETYYNDIVINYMFEKMKEIKIDFIELERVSKLSLQEMKEYPNNNHTKIILNEYINEFICNEINSYNFKDFIDEKMVNYNYRDDPKEYYLIRDKFENEWFSTEKIKNKFADNIHGFIDEFKIFNSIMMGEIEDDDSIGEILEHHFDWYRWFTYITFSHH